MMAASAGAGCFLVFWAIAVVFGLCAFGFWVWSLIDCLTRPDDSFEPVFGSVNPRIVWALIIFFTHILGTIIYLLIAGTKANPKRSGVQARAADPEESRRILEMIASGKITAAEGQRLLAALETKSQNATIAGSGSSSSKALKIGCLLLLAIPVLFIVLTLVAWLLIAPRRQAAHVNARAIMEQQVRAQLNQVQMGSLQITVTNVSPAATNP